jgi:Cu(I)/Ag(I) efflux system membrane fusion protein
VGKVEHDESLLTAVGTRTDGFIEELFVNKTGQHVKCGRAAFRPIARKLISPNRPIVAMRAGKDGA